MVIGGTIWSRVARVRTANVCWNQPSSSMKPVKMST
jgi:hypothetical protein